MAESITNGELEVSEMERDSQKVGQKTFNFENFGITGIEKDCGLSILEYETNIEKEDIIIRTALMLSNERMKHDIEYRENPDLESVKFEEKKIMGYFGATLRLKFKDGSKSGNAFGSDWFETARKVAIPVDNKIYIIWGTDEKFEVLTDMILSFK